MATLGSLVVSLEANIARFTSDMNRAAQQTQQEMGKMKGAVDMVKGALGALGIGVSAVGLAVLVKDAIDAADNLRDMSQKTGIAVETLNGLGFAAGQAGGDLESMVEAAGKVNKAIVDAAGGNKDVGEAFKVLGINVRDASGHLKTADVVIAEVADKFEGYADGPAKSAIALRIFGEAGAKMIPLLNDGGDAMRENIAYAETYSNVTTKLADGSDNFNDTMGKLTIQQKSFGNALAAQVLPLMQLVADEILGASEKSDKFAFASKAVRVVLETFLVTGSEVAFVFKAVGTEIGGIAAQLVALAQRDVKGFTAISDAMKADAKKAREEHDAFIAAVLGQAPEVATKEETKPDKPKRTAPTLRAAGDDATKTLMDGRLKAIEAAYAAERDTASYHDKYMQELRAQDLVDMQTYEAYKMAATDNGAASAQRAYDAQIAVLQKARASAVKETERADIDNKIKDVSAKKEQALLNAQQDRSLAVLALSAAQSDLNKSMADWGLQQDQAIAQMEFSNNLYGKSSLVVAQLAEARRAELEVEEKIRLAKEKGAISEESIARFQAQAKLKSAGANKQQVVSAVNGIRQDQQTPGEVENNLHSDRTAAVQNAIDKEYETIAAGNQLLELENQRHEDAMLAIKTTAARNVLDGAASSASQLYDALQQAGLEQTALGKVMFAAQKAIQIASIIVNTEVAAAAAQAGMIAAASATAAVSGPAGPGIIAAGVSAGAAYAAVTRAMGYATAGLVAGTAIASAEGGYDIPAGTNPVTQLHEKEMVLPKAHADVIRGMAAGGGAGGGATTIINQTTGRIDSVTETRLSNGERALILKEATDQAVATVAAQMSDPNSKTSRSMGRNFSAPRSR